MPRCGAGGAGGAGAGGAAGGGGGVDGNIISSRFCFRISAIMALFQIVTTSDWDQIMWCVPLCCLCCCSPVFRHFELHSVFDALL